jgi:hypothetical protein
MDRLNALLEKQYRQYRQRMDYLTRHFRWKVRMPWEDSTKA